MAVFFAGSKCYKVRNQSTYLSETKDLALSMASLLETVIVFVPLLIATKKNPPAYFVAMSIMIAITCLSLLLPIFINKILRQDAAYEDARRDEQQIKELNDLLASLEKQDGDPTYCGDNSTRGQMVLIRHDSNDDCDSLCSHKSYRSARAYRSRNFDTQGTTRG